MYNYAKTFTVTWFHDFSKWNFIVPPDPENSHTYTYIWPHLDAWPWSKWVNW